MEYTLKKEECGCRINQAYNEEPFISYCPLHESAPALYEALERIKKNCFKDKRGAYWIGRVDMANVEETLDKTEGKNE